MKESILNFAKQFSYQPEVQNSDKIKESYKNYILGGMGGSHLAAGILHAHTPGINLYIHRDYGIPAYDDEFNKESLFIASSYSGNTEEVLDFADEAYSKGYDILVITTDGKLLEFAKDNGLSYIQLPDDGIQPRLAIGYSTIALSSVVAPNLVPELNSLQEIINSELIEKDGKELSNILENKIPVIFSSNKNKSIAYNWKIKMNETGKIPSFYNVFPELNHNEMQGYDFIEKNQHLSNNFHFIFIKDKNEHPRVLKRMEVLEEQFQEKGFAVNTILLDGESRFEQIFKSLVLADWTALGLADFYNTEPEQVPLIEDFKKRIK
jgi:glucose/mannose-6-phosphate isomerase